MKNYYISLTLLLLLSHLSSKPILETTKIAGTLIFTSALFGITHDCLTAHYAPEIFTKLPNHADQFSCMKGVENKLLLGLFWGSVYAPLFGLGFGVPVATCARLGHWKTLEANALIKPFIGMFFGILAPLCAYSVYTIGNNPSHPDYKRIAREYDSLNLKNDADKSNFIKCNASHEAIYYYGKRVLLPTLCVYTLYKRYITQ